MTLNIVPKWARRSKSLDALLPALYLRGISTGDFREVKLMVFKLVQAASKTW